jgi:hypothetical protein
MDNRLYPQGRTSSYSKYVANVLKFFRRSDQTEFFSIDGAVAQLYVPNLTRSIHVTPLVAVVEAGLTLLAAIPGYKYRIVDCTMIATGANAANATSVDIVGTQAGSAVQLVVNSFDALTDSARVSMGEAPAAGTAVILADGASFNVCDANTAITCIAVGGAGLDTATAIDITLTYVIERA